MKERRNLYFRQEMHHILGKILKLLLFIDIVQILQQIDHYLD
jgi:hypothetical protein